MLSSRFRETLEGVISLQPSTQVFSPPLDILHAGFNVADRILRSSASQIKTLVVTDYSLSGNLMESARH